MRLLWITDIHLNFIPTPRRQAFYAHIRETQSDAVILGGDIGEADSSPLLLREMALALPIPIYFVLGNHDFYHGSLAEVRKAIGKLCAGVPNLHWLSTSDVVSLTPHTALIGHDSWADGRCGDFDRSEVVLNDYLLIKELRNLTRNRRFAKLNDLGDEAAGFLEARARQALKTHNRVIVLTHVPPFRGACWHEGQISADDWLPHFACQAVGERLAALMEKHPANCMEIYCGHTHSPGLYTPLANLTVHTGAAAYGQPVVQRIIENH